MLALGIWSNGLFRQPVWTPSGLRALVIFSGVYWALAWGAPRYARILLPAAMLLWAMISAGWLAGLSVILMIAGAYGFGSLVAAGPTAIAAGLGFYAVLTSVLVRFPLHSRIPYWLLVAAGLYLARHCRPTVRIHFLPFYLASIHLLAALFPEVGSDSLSIRLTIPAWVETHGKWDFDPSHFSWSLMPMNGDWAFSFAYLLGGGESAARLLNLALILLTAWTIYGIARRFAGEEASLLAATLFLSTPVTYFLSGSLFVESFWTLMICAALAAVAGESLWLTAGFLGVAIASKLLAVIFAVPLAAAAIWKAVRRKALPAAAAAAVFTLVLGIPPYVEAWVKTGNPVFPLMNSVFRSPLFSTVMPVTDVRYPPALTWNFFWTATFASSRYLDGHDGSLGFHYLLLILPACWLWRRSPWLARVTLAAATISGAAILSQMGYLRYLLPALALSCAAFAFTIDTLRARRAAFVIIGLNVYFLAASSFYTRDFWMPPWSRDAYLREAAPIRSLVEFLNKEAPGQPVAFLDDDVIAGLAGKPWTASWHTWTFLAALDNANSPAAVLRVFDRHGLRWAVGPALTNWYALHHGPARALLQTCGEVASRNGNFAVWRIRDNCAPGRVDAIYLESTPLVEIGEYDDIDPGLRYSGPWIHDHQFAEAAGHTLTYTSAPGSYVQLRFRGRKVRIVYTAASNRGEGDITMDGKPVRRLNQNSSATKWQAEVTVDAGVTSEHLLKLTFRPGQAGKYLDLDRLIVE